MSHTSNVPNSRWLGMTAGQELLRTGGPGCVGTCMANSSNVNYTHKTILLYLLYPSIVPQTIVITSINLAIKTWLLSSKMGDYRNHSYWYLDIESTGPSLVSSGWCWVRLYTMQTQWPHRHNIVTQSNRTTQQPCTTSYNLTPHNKRIVFCSHLLRG